MHHNGLDFSHTEKLQVSSVTIFGRRFKKKKKRFKLRNYMSEISPSSWVVHQTCILHEVGQSCSLRWVLGAVGGVLSRCPRHNGRRRQDPVTNSGGRASSTVLAFRVVKR